MTDAASPPEPPAWYTNPPTWLTAPPPQPLPVPTPRPGSDDLLNEIRRMPEAVVNAIREATQHAQPTQQQPPPAQQQQPVQSSEIEPGKQANQTWADKYWWGNG